MSHQSEEYLNRPRSTGQREVKEFYVENFLIKKKEEENCIVVKDNKSNRGVKIIIEDKANLREVFAYLEHRLTDIFGIDNKKYNYQTFIDRIEEDLIGIQNFTKDDYIIEELEYHND